jgi:hypothetical protein
MDCKSNLSMFVLREFFISSSFRAVADCFSLCVLSEGAEDSEQARSPSSKACGRLVVETYSVT